MIDFTNCKEVFNNYHGSEKKKTLIYNGKKYLVKFPDPIREKNKDISYINNVFSEYIGSNIFKICGFNVQNTILGTYNYNGIEKIVCACEDFLEDKYILTEFETLTLSFNMEKKIGTNIKDIMNVLLGSDYLINYEDTKNQFYDMFIIDTLIGNSDRHNSNWGFLVNEVPFDITFSPIYDCGSCLNPLMEDDEIKNLTDTEFKNLVVNTYSCLKENDQKINSIAYIKEGSNIECNKALLRIFDKIDINKIMEFIDNIEPLTFVRKEFYKQILKERYLILKDIYNKLVMIKN